jgi:uncharacterized protein
MRRTAWVGLVVMVTAIAADLARAPEHQIGARVAVAGIHAYQATASRLFAAAGATCRFDPTCSHYGEAVIRRYGLVRGGWMAGARVLRCGPWTPLGTPDPPPVGA